MLKRVESVKDTCEYDFFLNIWKKLETNYIIENYALNNSSLE